MNIQPRKPELQTMIAALALGLGVAACQDKPTAENANIAASERAVNKPAAAAEEKPTPENNMTKPAAAADTDLAARVKAALNADPAMRALAVDVTAAGNAVTLLGTADDTASRDKASQIALGVQGVNSVENRIVIVRGS